MIRQLAFFAALLIAAFAPFHTADAATSFPALTGRVVDETGVLSAPVQARLTAELAAHEQRSGQQVVVAVVKSLGGLPIEDYGVELGRTWGIGQKGANSGAILLVAPAERKVRIEVGYGLEGDLTDAASATIVNQIVLPRFRQGDMQGGIVAGAEAILTTLGDDLPAPAPIQSQRPQPGGHISIGSVLLTFLIFGFFLWMARRRGGGVGSAILPFIVASSWGRGGSSSFGSDGSGGGGFSGGGGSFGGGGASGSW